MTRSSELSAGSGFTFENLVAARCLAALLTETSIPGIEGVVVEVLLQQRDLGEPLDDVIVKARTASGRCARLSLQCKSRLILSDATTNSDFREVVRDCMGTLGKIDFQVDLDRYGAAVGRIADDSFRVLTSLCEIARSSDTLAHFTARFETNGNASQAVRQMKGLFADLIGELGDVPCTDDYIHRFLRHFVVVRFDYLHEGAIDAAESINAVRPALREGQESYTGALWALLCEIAREGAGRSAQFSRHGLVARIDRTIPLAAARSLQPDLATLARLASDWTQDIDDDVSGVRLLRRATANQLSNLLSTERLVQVRGLPGVGKSVVLRQRIEADLECGPVVFLKSDRLEGASWSSFAQHVGLSATPLLSLLMEVGTVGSAVLYVDGIDRIEKQHQGVVLDVVRAILREPLLGAWRIVFSLRDAGAEPVRTWIPEIFEAGRLATLEVSAFDDPEAEILAEAREDLRPLLFGSEAVREIVRRPFFAKVLSQQQPTSAPHSRFTPASEIDLADNWWLRGGLDAIGAEATIRQRALVELAAKRAMDLSHPVQLADLSASTIGVLDELVRDGILGSVRPGHSVQFSHDIFFEWALYHRLVDRGVGWIEEIRSVGEPPAIGRVVELLSQSDFIAQRNWEQTLSNLATSSMRSQWTRAWLLGPLFGGSFDRQRESYFANCSTNEFLWLRRCLVWFQAEKTTPNAAILGGALPNPNLRPHELIRLADSFGWPSDLSAWRRFLLLLLDNIDDIPIALAADITVVFEVWQNAVGEISNPISSRFLDRAVVWLQEIENNRHARFDRHNTEEWSRWEQLGADLPDLENSLRSLVLRSAAVAPALVETYLTSLQADKRRLDKVYREIAPYSKFLSQRHAVQFVEISLLHYRKELPGARLEREARERRAMNRRIEEAQSKAVEDRSREDEMVLSGAFSTLGSSFNDFEWDRLAIGEDVGMDFPASPLREPFHSLLSGAPSEGLRLIRELTNHAVTAWRHLHRIDRRRRGTPIPIELEFPWGKQQFWGNGREYLWARGVCGPNVLESAYLSLEAWAFQRLASGQTPDSVIEEIVKGNESVAALGVAVAFALRAKAATTVTLPLFTCQRLWKYDLARLVQERQTSSATVIGFDSRRDWDHLRAVRDQNALQSRQSWLRDGIILFFVSSDPVLESGARAAISAFQTEPAFEFEEEKVDPERIAALEKDGRFNAEFAKEENLKVTVHPKDSTVTMAYLDNPLSHEPEAQEIVKANTVRRQELSLWSWASTSLEQGRLVDDLAAARATALARELDHAQLYLGSSESISQDLDMRRGAVAGAAAVVLKFRAEFQPDDVQWAMGIVRRAAEAPERFDELWSSSAIVPWHHCIFAAQALGAQLRTDDTADAKIQLLRLVAHPLDCVAVAALEACCGLWDYDARLSWCAIWEALRLCRLDLNPATRRRRAFSADSVVATREAVAKEAIAHWEVPGRWPALPAMPVAWTAAGDFDGSDRDNDATGGEGDRKWRRPDIEFDWNWGGTVLRAIPVDRILADAGARSQLLSFIDDLVRWMLDKLVPPWTSQSRRDSRQELGHLDDEIAHLFAKMTSELETVELRRLFLDRIFGLDDELCFELLSPYVSLLVAISIYDAVEVTPRTIGTLELCLERTLRDRVFAPKSYRAGEIHGYHLPSLVRSYFFISVEKADCAVRFANGAWNDLSLVIPIIDRLVRAAGWSASVMSQYLTLVERASGFFPTDLFAEQLLAILTDEGAPIRGWRGSLLPARIAGIVQSLAFRETPLEPALAQRLLRILDVLVDMGDRRSAALQIGDTFREVRIANSLRFQVDSLPA